MLEFNDLEKAIYSTGTETDTNKLKKARAKIVLSIEPHLYVHIQNCSTAVEIWAKLKSMFEDKGVTRRIGLINKLITTRLETSNSLEEYIGEIIGTANKLNGIGFTIDEEWVGSFLLAGLTAEYKPFIMGIESSGIEITGDSIKSRLFDMCSNEQTEHAMFSKKKRDRDTRDKQKSKPKCFECNKIGHKSSDCWLKKSDTRNQRDGDKKSYATTTTNAFSAVLLSHNGNSATTWFVDSGASQHACSEEHRFVNVRKTPTKKLGTASGNYLPIKFIGDTSINVKGIDIVLKNVLCVPKIAANLISVSQLTANKNKVQFLPGGCVIKNHKNEFVCKAILENGVYKLNASVPSAMLTKSADDIIEWHRKLGHLNYRDVAKLTNITSNVRDKCEVCIKAKQPRLPFESRGNRCEFILERVHADLCDQWRISLSGRQNTS